MIYLFWILTSQVAMFVSYKFPAARPKFYPPALSEAPIGNAACKGPTNSSTAMASLSGGLSNAVASLNLSEPPPLGSVALVMEAANGEAPETISGILRPPTGGMSPPVRKAPPDKLKPRFGAKEENGNLENEVTVGNCAELH